MVGYIIVFYTMNNGFLFIRKSANCAKNDALSARAAKKGFFSGRGAKMSLKRTEIVSGGCKKEIHQTCLIC